MNTQQIENIINQYIHEHSNFDEKRDYLGISQVAGCPRRAYNNYMNGMEVNEQTFRMSFAGYDQEHSIRAMLGSWVGAENMEVIAPFDNRLRGHIDGRLDDGSLLEIKSVTVKKFEKVRETRRALNEHFNQCQLYMRYGNFPGAFIIYRCRETYEHLIIHVNYSKPTADKLEEKAKQILQAIDAKQPPACECGYCK